MASCNSQDITQYLIDRKEQIQMVLPSHIDVKRILRIVATEIKRTPNLLNCDRASVFSAIVQSCQLGLEPGNTLGQAYLVPYGKACQLIIGYRGLIELARRSGQISRISAHCVYEQDSFDYQYGSQEMIRHTPTEHDRGNFKAVYAIAHFKDQSHQIEVMWQEDIKRLKKRTGSRLGQAWETDFEEMAKKTVIRRLCKYLPLSPHSQHAITLDEMVEADLPQKNEAMLSSDVQPKSKLAQLNYEVQQLINDE